MTFVAGATGACAAPPRLDVSDATAAVARGVSRVTSSTSLAVATVLARDWKLEHDFVENVVQFLHKMECTHTIVATSMVYLQRLQKVARVQVREDGRHRIVGWQCFCASVMLACKFLVDQPYSNRVFSTTSKIPLRELNRAESTILGFVNYNLAVYPKDLSNAENAITIETLAITRILVLQKQKQQQQLAMAFVQRLLMEQQQHQQQHCLFTSIYHQTHQRSPSPVPSLDMSMQNAITCAPHMQPLTTHHSAYTTASSGPPPPSMCAVPRVARETECRTSPLYMSTSESNLDGMFHNKNSVNNNNNYVCRTSSVDTMLDGMFFAQDNSTQLLPHARSHTIAGHHHYEMVGALPATQQQRQPQFVRCGSTAVLRQPQPFQRAPTMPSHYQQQPLQRWVAHHQQSMQYRGSQQERHCVVQQHSKPSMHRYARGAAALRHMRQLHGMASLMHPLLS